MVSGKRKLINMNFFQIESSISEMQNVHRVAILSSRVYLVLLTLSAVILGLFSGLGVSIVSVTVNSPSIAAFEQLHFTHPTTLKCPCTSIAIPHNTSLFISASFHQVSGVGQSSSYSE